MKPVIALVGRPNVGKSTLFNRLTRSRQALVDDHPGLTRDRLEGEGRFGERAFRVLDTGGLENREEEAIFGLVARQTWRAVEMADGVVFIVDGVAGPLPGDADIAAQLRRLGKPMILAVNKSEGKKGEANFHDFHSLGFADMVAVSSAHGIGVEEMLETLFEQMELPEEGERQAGETGGATRVALLGCPNVGKSSLVNALLGEERQLVSEVPGTTRDSVDLTFRDEKSGEELTLVDTAGVRRRSRIDAHAEKISVSASLRSVERAQVVLVILDGTRYISDQDQRLARFAADAGRGMLFVVNKWDIAPAPASREAFTQHVRDCFPTLTHVPVSFVSARTGWNVAGLPAGVARVHAAWSRRVGTGPLNRWLRAAVTEAAPPRTPGGGPVKIPYATQVEAGPPSVVLFSNHPEAIRDSYRRYLENSLRRTFEFEGTPVRFFFRKGGGRT